MSINYVSIIVCHYAKYDDFGEKRRRGGPSRSDMLRITMQSLEANTEYPAELIVVDNGGDPDDSDYLLARTRRDAINTYIRYKENMNFAFAWNQGAKVATGDYLCFTCNDIEFLEGWLTDTIKPLLDHPERKLIASPLVTPEKNKEKYKRGTLDGYRLNSLAGSNCILLKRTVFEELGEFKLAPSGGTYWHRHMSKQGYRVVIPPENKAIHLGSKGGVNFYEAIRVKRKLLKGQEIDFSYDTSVLYKK